MNELSKRLWSADCWLRCTELLINAYEQNKPYDLICRLKRLIIEIDKYSDSQPRDEHGRWTDGGAQGAAFGVSGEASPSDGTGQDADKQARHLYDKMTKEERAEVIQRGQNEPKAVFSYDRPYNKAMSYLQKAPKEPDTFDVMSHGTPDRIEFFRQDYPNGDRRANIDAYTLSCILKGRSDYKAFVADCQQRGVTPTVRLLSCNTGNTTNTGDCFAQLLANELGHNVTAPTETLYVNPNGSYKIGRNNTGTMKPFFSRKN